MDFKLPDIGEGIAEGEIVKWKVQEGDAVREDQPLVEVMTDKATVEIPSPRSGVIKRIVALEGQVVPVGSVLVVIDETGTPSAAAAAPAHAVQAVGSHSVAARSESSVAVAERPVAGTGKVLATPATRKLAHLASTRPDRRFRPAAKVKERPRPRGSRPPRPRPPPAATFRRTAPSAVPARSASPLWPRAASPSDALAPHAAHFT